jgi:hypothetical protein
VTRRTSSGRPRRQPEVDGSSCLASRLYAPDVAILRCLDISREASKEGYLAGWRSIRGAASPPPIPSFTAPLPGETPFRAGFILGVRAGWRPGSPSGASNNIDDWIDHALRRALRPHTPSKDWDRHPGYRSVPSSRGLGGSGSPRLRRA